jgi:hypothetical protein
MPPTTTEQRIATKIAEEIGCRPQQVQATAALLDEGATVPFIARYRKEVTGGLDDIQLRLLDERLSYLRELEERRCAVLASIEEQGKLTAALSAERSTPRKPSSVSKTSTCRTSRSGAARRRSPAKPALSRSPTPCCRPDTVPGKRSGTLPQRRGRLRRRQERPRRRPPDPDGAVLRRRRAARRAAQLP